MAPEISIIVVTFADEIAEIDSVQRLEEQGFGDWELIVRTDKGISTARNRGIEQANADKIVFIDDDAIPEPGYLEAASKALDQHAIVGGKVMHPDTIFKEFANLYRQDDDAGPSEHLVGCNMAFRREVFETVGGFDERLKWGHDETELLSRAKGHYEVWYEPEMAVTHSYADSITGLWKKWWRFGPADVYYGMVSGGEDGDIKNLIGLRAFCSDSLKGTAIKCVGRIIRNTSIALALLKRNRGEHYSRENQRICISIDEPRKRR